MTRAPFIHDDWMWAKYGKPLGLRYPTFRAALNLLLRFGGETIVETGTMRNMDIAGAGGSTLLFGEHCSRHGGKLWTVDINPQYIAYAKQATAAFAGRIDYATGDSVEFLTKFAGTIHLLYLDSMDCPPDPAADAGPSQRHCLAELGAAWGKVPAGGIVLLDDNMWPNGGKTRMAKGRLEELGAKCVLDFYQTLWIKGERDAQAAR